jgi:hypothetical protein
VSLDVIRLLALSGLSNGRFGLAERLIAHADMLLFGYLFGDLVGRGVGFDVMLTRDPSD